MNLKTNNNVIYLGFLYSTIFGFSFMFTKLTLAYVLDIYHMLAFRFLIAFVVMTILLLFKIIKVNYRGKKLRMLFLLGLFQPIIYFVFETKGIELLPSSQAGIMIACIPIIVMIFAFIFLNEKITLKRLVFIMLSVFGAIIINVNNFSGGSIRGLLFLFIAVLAGAIYNILSRKLHLEFSAIEITYLMMGFGAIVFNGLSLGIHINKEVLLDYFKPLTSPQAIIGFLYLSILSSIVAFFVLNYILSKAEASKVAVFANFTTVVSIFAGVVIMNEIFMWQQLIGAIMIIIGVYFTQKQELVMNIT
ncbi:MAG: EamA family transporter [Firmicutes bacterium HGW-Firmicutes-7]|nr:MAG: EamA family transporter [Firmicutes bacterium HGW-Firmicutes-7]